MSLRCLVVVCLFLAAESASINSRNIPVEIVYEKNSPLHFANRNLDAKIQLTSDELLKLKLSDEIIKEDVIEAQVDEAINEELHGNSYGVRNLDAKVQLSPDEIGQAVKVLPDIVNDQESEKSIVSDEKETSVQEVKPESNDLFTFLKKAEEIAYSGINSIRNNIEKASEVAANSKPNAETWIKLNETVQQFFKDQHRRVDLKDDKPPENQNNQNQNNQNQNNEFVQSIISNFVTTVQNFMGNNSNTQKPPGSEDEQQGPQDNQNVFQNIGTFFSNGFTTIVNNMNNWNSQNPQNGTGQEDTGSSPDGGFNFGTVITSIQNFFSGQSNQGNNPSQSVNTNNQSDTGVQQPSNPANIFQGVINNVINNFRPSTSTQAPVQGDEGTASSTTTQSSIFNNINQAFQNVIGPSTQAPQGGGTGSSGATNPIAAGAQVVGQFVGSQGGSGGGAPSNPFASGAQTVGQFISNATSGGGQGSPIPIPSNPQEVANQIGQFAGQGGQGGSPSIPSNPQEVANQIGQFAGQGGQGGSLPIPSNPQEVANQIGQFAGQGGQGGSFPIPSSPQDITNQIGQFTGQSGNPIENIQNAIGGGSSTAAPPSTEKTKVAEQELESIKPLPEAGLKEEKKNAENVEKSE